MSDDYEDERLAYMWQSGYDRDDEYEKNPQWALDMEVYVDETIDKDGRAHTHTIFYDQYDPEHIWIKSDFTLDLTNML